MGTEIARERMMATIPLRPFSGEQGLSGDDPGGQIFRMSPSHRIASHRITRLVPTASLQLLLALSSSAASGAAREIKPAPTCAVSVQCC